MALDPITGIIGLADTIISRVWEDPADRARAYQKVQELEASGELHMLAAAVAESQGQINTNIEEAKSSSMFVAGWRPFIGWTCGAAWAWVALIGPIAQWGLAIIDPSIELPHINHDHLFELTLGMLGLGGLRTFEKLKGVQS